MLVGPHPLQSHRRPISLRSTPLRKSSHRRRCGHSSPRPRRKCSARARAAAAAWWRVADRSRWLACEGVQTVRRPSLKSATAHDGPIDPCVLHGEVVGRLQRSAARLSRLAGRVAGASAALRCGRSSSCARIRRACDSSGKPAQADHVATIAVDALIAAHSLVATTARKLPLRTART